MFPLTSFLYLVLSPVTGRIADCWGARVMVGCDFDGSRSGRDRPGQQRVGGVPDLRTGGDSGSRVAMYRWSRGKQRMVSQAAQHGTWNCGVGDWRRNIGCAADGGRSDRAPRMARRVRSRGSCHWRQPSRTFALEMGVSYGGAVTLTSAVFDRVIRHAGTGLGAGDPLHRQRPRHVPRAAAMRCNGGSHRQLFVRNRVRRRSRDCGWRCPATPRPSAIAGSHRLIDLLA